MCPRILGLAIAVIVLSSCQPPPTVNSGLNGKPGSVTPGGGGAGSAKPGYIVGTATYADGRPIPSFQVSAESGVTLTAMKGEGHDGYYEIKIDDPNSLIIYNVDATVDLPLGDNKYTFSLDPTDGLPSYPASNKFEGEAQKGVVRNFVLHVSGIRPDDKEGNWPEIDGGDQNHGKFFGGDVDVRLAKGVATDSTLEIDLIPTGPLIDGTQGKPINRQTTLKAGSFATDLHNVPIGTYTAMAKLNGTAVPMTMKVYGTPLEVTTPSNSVSLTWVTSGGNSLSWPTLNIQN